MNEKRRREIEAMRTIDGMWVAGSFGVSKAVDDLLAEIDRLTPDALLGAAVRGMEEWPCLWKAEEDAGPCLAFMFARDHKEVEHVSTPLGYRVSEMSYDYDPRDDAWYPTPEAALKAAGLWPED